MNDENLARFRGLIETRLADLTAEDQLGETGQTKVELDQ